MRKYLLAVLGSVALAVSMILPANVALAYGVNGRICTALKGNTTTVGWEYDVWMDSGRGLIDMWATPARGSCTDTLHPGWSIESFSIPAWTQCYSQWGYIYKSNKGTSKRYTWTGTSSTSLTLQCIKVYIDGSW